MKLLEGDGESIVGSSVFEVGFEVVVHVFGVGLLVLVLFGFGGVGDELEGFPHAVLGHFLFGFFQFFELFEQDIEDLIDFSISLGIGFGFFSESFFIGVRVID
mgnify:CR=1 FL=1